MMYMLKQCSMYVHKYVCTLRCIWAPPPHHSRCSTYISLVGFSLITRGWPLAFFACLINECQLGCLPACQYVTISLRQRSWEGRAVQSRRKWFPSITHLSFGRKYLCDGLGEDVTLLAAACMCEVCSGGAVAVMRCDSGSGRALYRVYHIEMDETK